MEQWKKCQFFFFRFTIQKGIPFFFVEIFIFFSLSLFLTRIVVTPTIMALYRYEFLCIATSGQSLLIKMYLRRCATLTHTRTKIQTKCVYYCGLGISCLLSIPAAALFFISFVDCLFMVFICLICIYIFWTFFKFIPKIGKVI